MKNNYQSFPEVMFVDSTHKLVDLKTPVYVIMTEDGNGQSDIACMGLLATEDEETFTWFLETFKEMNPSWDKTRIVMTDKDVMERSVFKKQFPGVLLLLYVFHVLRTFKREITCNKLGITPGQQAAIRELLQKMVYAKNENEYNDFYKQLETSAPQTVMDYFNDNWHNIKDEWTLGMMFNTGNFLNSINLRLESFNSKLKAVIPVYSSLQSFVENLYVLLKCFRRERDHKAALMIQKIPTNPHPPGSTESRYFSFLTPYAFKIVSRQLLLLSKVKEPQQQRRGFIISTSEGMKSVNATECGCMFNKSMRLPCTHIFAVRKKIGLDAFSEELCDQRWGRSYYLSTQQVFQFQNASSLQETHSTEQAAENNIRVLPPKPTLTTWDKFKKASMLTTQIAYIVSEVSDVHFERKMQFLQQILSAWEHGVEVGCIIKNEKRKFNQI